LSGGCLQMILTRFVAAVTQRVALEVEVINCLQVWINSEKLLLAYMTLVLTNHLFLRSTLGEGICRPHQC